MYCIIIGIIWWKIIIMLIIACFSIGNEDLNWITECTACVTNWSMLVSQVQMTPESLRLVTECRLMWALWLAGWFQGGWGGDGRGGVRGSEGSRHVYIMSSVAVRCWSLSDGSETACSSCVTESVVCQQCQLSNWRAVFPLSTGFEPNRLIRFNADQLSQFSYPVDHRVPTAASQTGVARW